MFFLSVLLWFAGGETVPGSTRTGISPANLSPVNTPRAIAAKKSGFSLPEEPAAVSI